MQESMHPAGFKAGLLVGDLGAAVLTSALQKAQDLRVNAVWSMLYISACPACQREN